MNAERLLAYFDRIAEAPEAVPRLRRFILDLAVRGKLVEQAPADAPVETLISRIHTERHRRARDGESVAIEYADAAEEGGFLIPETWRWIRLGFLVNVIMGQSPPGETYNTSADGVPLINGPVEFSVGPFGTTVVNQYTTAPSKLCRKGDLLLCVRGSTTGRTNVAGFDACIGRGVAALQPLYDDRFVRLFVWSWRDRIIEMGRGIAFPSISREQIEDLPVPLPPLAEQQRIVTKVDELMALCDELEAAQAQREARRDRMVAATLAGLNDGEVTFAEGGPASTRSVGFYFSHLPQLTTRPEHIQQLRQAVLSLAVRGKLVPQEPGDEPASELLDRIDIERSLVATKDARADEEAQEILNVNLRWNVPPTWEWRGLADLALFIDYRGQTPPKVTSGTRLITAKNIRRGFVDLNPEEFVSEATYFQWMTRGLPQEGDVLFTTEAPMGNAAVVDLKERFALAQRTICFRLFGGLDPRFVTLQLLSSDFQAVLDHSATGLTAKGIKAAKLKRLPFAVPPLGEQRRIVAKVDELMALCDQLEARLSAATQVRSQLLEAVLQEVLVTSGSV